MIPIRGDRTCAEVILITNIIKLLLVTTNMTVILVQGVVIQPHWYGILLLELAL